MLKLRGNRRSAEREEWASLPRSTSQVLMNRDDVSDITLCSTIMQQEWTLPYMPAMGDVVILRMETVSYKSIVGVVEKITHQQWTHEGPMTSNIWCREMQ